MCIYANTWAVIQQHAESSTHPTRRGTLIQSTRTRRALRHPSISRQTYHRDKVGPPNPQANQESCVSFPFRSNRDHEARVARSAALEPRVMLIPPSATRPERAKLSQVLDGTVNTVERRRIPRIRPWTCLLYTSPSPRDGLLSRMPSSA